jgi:hypothetical protein
MRQSTYIEIDSKKVAVVRNPYERVITLYRESWDWIGLSDWLEKNEIIAQSELYKDCEYIISLESWKEDLDALGLEPEEKEVELLYKKYSTDYRTWYGRPLKTTVTPLVQSDLDTYGYRF